MKLQFRCMTASVLLLILGSTILAQQSQTSSGGYTTYVGDQPFGTESYTVTRNADGSTKSEAEIAFTGTKFRATTIIAGNRPTSYTMEMKGAVALKEEFTSEGVKVTVPGQPDKQVKAQPRALLENGVAHHYIFLMQMYDAARGGAQTIEVFLPSQALAFTLDLERVDSPTFTVGTQQVATEHFKARTNLGLSLEIWTNTAHVPLLIQLAAQRLKIVRQGAEALAAVILPPPAARRAPAASDPYQTEEVVFQNGEQKLAGTLTLPRDGTARLSPV